MAKSPSPKNKVADTSIKVFQREKITYDLHIRERNDLTAKQVEILKAALDKDTRCVFADGIYGSAKTYTAVLASLKLLQQKKVDQIIYVRNPVESSSTGKMGYLKGSATEKLEPYASILFDKLEELLPVDEIKALEEDGRIECVPLGFTRGKNWACKAVIVDESASCSYDDLILLLTRCAEFTRIFFVGDSLNQSDIGAKSGFRKMFEKFNDAESKEHGIHCFELREEADIVRSKWLRFVLKHLEIIK
jgi:phosphate starvation-inducible protein PhoH